MFAGKFVIKNLEQHVTISYAKVITARNPNYEFKANEIPISDPHCMFHITISREPKECKESTYFEAGYYQYNSHTNSKNGYMKLRIFDPTNALQTYRLTPRLQKQSSGLSTVIDKAAALSQNPALSTNINLALNILELSTVNSAQDRRVQVEDAPEDDNEFEILEETVVEEVPKKK
ncbi:6757_t:CDS:2 [Gigaspora margarita]|uniref:6757_t:CDS:1 n=1 Tax=Gigaspora margarita TaxID=4874 RepID=A0ABN7UT35_GIGMA|nr:6757_t:CDS:2 [Gigaspora margarita]